MKPNKRDVKVATSPVVLAADGRYLVAKPTVPLPTLTSEEVRAALERVRDRDA